MLGIMEHVQLNRRERADMPFIVYGATLAALLVMAVLAGMDYVAMGGGIVAYLTGLWLGERFK
jgi:hypothetical protein